MPLTGRKGRWLGVGLFSLAALAGFVWACFPRTLPEPSEEKEPPWFQDVTAEKGLDFVHDAGPVDGRYFMPQSIGSGGALFDFDGDGLLDIYLLQNGGVGGKTNRLYRQQKDGTFQDVSVGSGLDIAGYNMGVAVGDVNNDGRPDVVVTQYGGVRLFLNEGNGRFTDVTQEAGLENPHWGVSAAFFDHDRDGWLDLVIVNYVAYTNDHACPTAKGKLDFCAPHPFLGSVTRLFRNLGKEGIGKAARVRFADVTIASGLGNVAGPGLGVVCADFDGDGWPDIFVANDGKPNHLWISHPNPDKASRTPRVFTEEAVARGLAVNAVGQAQANMGTALADVNGDGLLDLFVTHVSNEQHALWEQGPRGFFRERTGALGLTEGRWRATGFGTVLADFNQDGQPDLAVVNGDIHAVDGPLAPEAVAALGPFWAQYAQRNQLFAGSEGGRFRDLSRTREPFCAVPNVGRGLICGDVDGDGSIDLLVTSIAGPARLYCNRTPHRGRWLMVRPIDPAGNRDAHGSRITVEAGGRRRVGLVNPGQSFLCSHDPRVHFGLGSAERYDSLRVVWPDGVEEEYAGGRTNQVVVLRRGEGKTVPR